MSRSSISIDQVDIANTSDHEEIPLDMESSSPSSDLSPTERIISAFKDEIRSSSKNNISQLFMIITSGMYVAMTTREDGVLYYLSAILSSLIFINVIILLFLIFYRKKAFKTKDGQCQVKTMKKASKLQKIYRGFSISLIVLQVLFTLVTGVSVSGAMDGHQSRNESTVSMETTTIGEYVVNNTSG